MKRAGLIFALALLAGCQLTPEKPNFSMTVAGNYKAVADCVYLDLASQTALWSKVDLDSMKKTRLTNKLGESTVGSADFVYAGPNRTEVIVALHGGIFGDKPANELKPRIAKCSG